MTKSSRRRRHKRKVREKISVRGPFDSRKKVEESRQRFNSSLLKEDEKVADAFSILYDCTPREANEFFDLQAENPFPGLSSVIRRIFFDSKGNNSKKLTMLEEKLEEVDRWVEESSVHPVVRRVREIEFDRKRAKQVLLESGAKYSLPLGDDWEVTDVVLYDQESGEDWDLLGFHRLEDATGIGYYLDQYENASGFDHIKLFASASRRVQEDGNPAAAKRFIDDLGAELQASHPVWLSMYEALFPREFVRLGKIAMPVIKSMAKRVSHYVDLRDKERLDLFSLLPVDGLSIKGRMMMVSRNFADFDAQDADVRTIPRLIGSVPDDQRVELLEYLIANPHAAPLYRKFKKNQITEDQYACFLLSQGGLRWGSQKRTLLDTVDEVAAIHVPSAVTLALNGSDFVLDERADKIFEIAKTYGDAPLVLGDYFEALRGEENQKASLFLKLGEYRPDAQQLSILRRSIQSFPDEAFEWANECNCLEDVTSNMKQMNSSSTRESSSPKQISISQQLSWSDMMISSLESQGFDSGVVGTVKKAYSLLSNGYLHRLRDIWRTQPDTLGSFCTDVTTLEEGVLYLLLKDHELFTAYKARIMENHGESSPLRRELSELASVQSSNLYRGLYKLLIPGTETEEIDLETDASDVEKVMSEASLPSYIKRIAIWGGHYSETARSRIQTARDDVEIVVFDYSSRQKQKRSSLSEGDLVIWISSFNDHSLYQGVKKMCKDHGLGFYHFNRSGSQSLANFLQGISILPPIKPR